ncbi:hypothetical protein [Nonomuraea basaltis]|uniref:hypothetical protein n=1 Tax=Nonomuraea basaltis TaxID=2495887 RepID=UPI00110C493E|nr:hypothetical protein [Nonomuraea basaltis]TMR89277.1 hypothetical protein EJK15_61590 [Nonomuraea basaltis]
MNRVPPAWWPTALTAALAALYGWIALAGHGLTRALALAGALLILTALAATQILAHRHGPACPGGAAPGHRGLVEHRRASARVADAAAGMARHPHPGSHRRPGEGLKGRTMARTYRISTGTRLINRVFTARGQPYVQAKFESEFSRRHQPVLAGARDPYRVAVQFVTDDGQVMVGLCGIEHLSRQEGPLWVPTS